VTLTSAAAAADAAWPVAGTAGSLAGTHLSVELSHGLRAVAALEVELTALAVSCAAPLTARPAWQLAAAAASSRLAPWVLLARDEAGVAVGAVVLVDHLQGRRTVRTTLGGTDGGHRGAILTDDPAVAWALGESWRAARAGQHRPPPVTLGPLPSDSLVVEAFGAGLSGSRQEPTDSIPVIDRAAGVDPADYLTDGMRRSLRKAANRLAGDGRAAVSRFTSDCAEIRGLLPQLEQVYRHRDHVHGRTSELDDTVGHQTWRHRVLDLAETGSLELATLHIDGELAAYALGIVDGAVYRLLEGRFVTGWARYSPGRLLEAMVVERALADAAVTTFDWMTAVAPESLLGRNDADPMVLVSLD
jgi:Acetyltransferase (GNAT) domain